MKFTTWLTWFTTLCEAWGKDLNARAFLRLMKISKNPTTMGSSETRVQQIIFLFLAMTNNLWRWRCYSTEAERFLPPSKMDPPVVVRFNPFQNKDSFTKCWFFMNWLKIRWAFPDLSVDLSAVKSIAQTIHQRAQQATNCSRTWSLKSKDKFPKLTFLQSACVRIFVDFTLSRPPKMGATKNNVKKSVV